MTDVFDRRTRSRVMASIRGRNTGPELLVRRFLYSRGLRYRLHAAELHGRPDIVLRRFCTVIFVHGCFWHWHTNCRYAVLPKSNRPFWKAKLCGNSRRDLLVASRLRRAGWRVLTIWECDLGEESLERLVKKIKAVRGATARRRRSPDAS